MATRYGIEIESPSTHEWIFWGSVTFEFRSVADEEALALQNVYGWRTRVVNLEGGKNA